MSPKIVKRGFDPNDAKLFSDEALQLLLTAQEEIQWLLDRNYKIGPVIDFIGSHYQLCSRQRTALQRAVSSMHQYTGRKSKMLPVEVASEDCLFIDGFNLVITLEVALSGSLLISCRDDVLRDLAGLRGTYRIIDKTDKALELIGKCFASLSVPSAVFYLDSPVSNSGRLRNRILEHAAKWNIPVEVILVPNADAVLCNMWRVVTADSVILDQCKSWFNLARVIVDNYIGDAWVINLTSKNIQPNLNIGHFNISWNKL